MQPFFSMLQDDFPFAQNIFCTLSFMHLSCDGHFMQMHFTKLLKFAGTFIAIPFFLFIFIINITYFIEKINKMVENI